MRVDRKQPGGILYKNEDNVVKAQKGLLIYKSIGAKLRDIGSKKYSSPSYYNKDYFKDNQNNVLSLANKKAAEKRALEQNPVAAQEVINFNRKAIYGNRLINEKAGQRVLNSLYNKTEANYADNSAGGRVNLERHGADSIVREDNGVRNYQPNRNTLRVNTDKRGKFSIQPSSFYNERQKLTYDDKTRLKKSNPNLKWDFSKALPSARIKTQRAIVAPAAKPVQKFNVPTSIK